MAEYTIHVCPSSGSAYTCGCDDPEFCPEVEVHVVPTARVQRLEAALEVIIAHADLDLSERGVREAQRYAVIARDALKGNHADR